MPFRFKQFTVEDSNCPMKVGTDSVLLGAWAKLENCRNLLDIGTGCGLLALMAAQRSKAQITAIDIDPVAIETAVLNFGKSPWKDRIIVRCQSLQEFVNGNEYGRFDHIISNPPYFINSLKAPDPERSNARHNDLLPFDVLANAVEKLLSPEGRLSLVLPVAESEIFILNATRAGLFLIRKMMIIPKVGKVANRLLLEFGRQQLPMDITELAIRNHAGEYTSAYKTLTAGFYLDF